MYYYCITNRYILSNKNYLIGGRIKYPECNKDLAKLREDKVDPKIIEKLEEREKKSKQKEEELKLFNRCIDQEMCPKCGEDLKAKQKFFSTKYTCKYCGFSHVD